MRSLLGYVVDECGRWVHLGNTHCIIYLKFVHLIFIYVILQLQTLQNCLKY